MHKFTWDSLNLTFNRIKSWEIKLQTETRISNTQHHHHHLSVSLMLSVCLLICWLHSVRAAFPTGTCCFWLIELWNFKHGKIFFYLGSNLKKLPWKKSDWPILSQMSNLWTKLLVWMTLIIPAWFMCPSTWQIGSNLLPKERERECGAGWNSSCCSNTCNELKGVYSSGGLKLVTGQPKFVRIP